MSTSSSGFLTASEVSALSRSNPLIWQEICFIQSEIITATSGGSGEVCISVTKSPFTYVGEITDITVAAQGTGYTPVYGEVVISDTTGTGATASFEINELGEVTSVSIIDGGINYGTPEVSISHPIGNGFESVAEVNAGVIVDVQIVATGNGYNQLSPTAIVLDSTGSGAKASLTVSDTGEITGVELTERGYLYSASTTAEVIPAETSLGSGAVLSVSVDSNTYGTDPRDYYLAVVDQYEGSDIPSQLSQIVSYFTELGYTIEAQVNRQTDSTMLWRICWC